MRRVLLASESPRRRELMMMSDIPFSCTSSYIEEHLATDCPIEEAVMQLADQKAQAAFTRYPEEFIIGADTVVVLGDQVLGKPADSEDSKRMLRLLSGKTHRVITGVALLSKDVHEHFYEETFVTFNELSEEDIEAYVKTKECHDKAGAYAIQGRGMLLVSRIEGDYANVVGLPMSHLCQELKKYIEK